MNSAYETKNSSFRTIYSEQSNRKLRHVKLQSNKVICYSNSTNTKSFSSLHEHSSIIGIPCYPYDNNVLIIYTMITFVFVLGPLSFAINTRARVESSSREKVLSDTTPKNHSERFSLCKRWCRGTATRPVC